MASIEEIIRQYAPECIVNGTLDLNLLKHRLSNHLPSNTPLETGEMVLQEGAKDASHILYVGDNLPIMQHLAPQMHSRCKCVYMDPPYNTGKQFLYTDRHSSIEQWLSWIAPRLTLAKDYLRADGIFLASIDDHAYAHLKVLCDRIFGMENHITTFIWRRSGAGGLRKIFPITTHEYILCYAKEKSIHKKPWHAPHSKDSMQAFRWKDEHGRYKKQALYHRTLSYRKAQHYPITLPDGRKAFPPPQKGAWRYIESRYLEEKAKGNICFVRSSRSPLRLEDGTPAPVNIYTKQYLIYGQSNPSSVLNPDLVGQTRTAKAELKEIFGSDVFLYAKPTKLLKHLFSLFPSKDEDIFLDMFAGSASAADAIYQLNPKLRSVSLQQAETCPKQSSAQLAGFQTIADLAWARINKRIPKDKARYHWTNIKKTSS